MSTNFGPIGQDVYARTYSRPTATGHEEWPDTVRRVVKGNFALDPDAPANEAYIFTALMDDLALLPAGRHLWVTGIDGIPGEARRNCFRAPFTHRFADHFEFMGSMLLLGGGVGANYSQEYLDLAPEIRLTDLLVTIDPAHQDYEAVKAAAGRHFVPSPFFATKVHDSREGWVKAWGALFDSATGFSPHPQSVVLDLSSVRPHGAEIKTFGGTASGPAPLVEALVGIIKILRGAVGRKLSGIEAMECDHAIASAVVAGGARRSARMSVMHWSDPSIFEFISCKTDHTKHWTTNISVEVDDLFFESLAAGELHATRILDNVVQGMYLNGEPGFYNVALSAIGERQDVRCTNPCGEVPLEEGESCNIGSVDLEEFVGNDAGAEAAFKLMARFLVRQTLTRVHVQPTAIVEARNRRIGVGFLGLQGWAAGHGVRYSDIPNSTLLRGKLRRFREAIRQAADEYCDELGIPHCIKVTAIAPNGTIAQLKGTQPGGHATLARWCFRNVRYTVGDPRIDAARVAGLKVEPCQYAGNTMVVSYPVADRLVEKFPADLIQQSDEVSISDQFAVLAMITEEFCGGTDGNAVSFTASFNPSDTSVEALRSAVEAWLPLVKGLTVFPTFSRPQAPYEPITEAEYLSTVSAEAQVDTGIEDLQACAGGACPIR